MSQQSRGPRSERDGARCHRGWVPGLVAPTWETVPGEVLASPVPRTASLCRCFPLCCLWINVSTPSLLHPSSFGGYFHPHFAGLPFRFSLHHLSLFERPGLDTLAWRKKPTSSQLPALPLAYCSGFMFDSNSTIYTAESSGPNRMSQEPARNLSFS